jgi:hypothetical protein
MKRSHDVDLDALMESLREERSSDDPWGEYADGDTNGDTNGDAGNDEDDHEDG